MIRPYTVFVLMVKGGLSFFDGTCFGESALPELPLALYGTIPVATPNPTTVTFTFATAGATITPSGPSQVVTVNSQTYYIRRIPFETRQIAGAPDLPATPNTLGLTPGDTTFTLTATINGQAATATSGSGPMTLTYGAGSQGLIRRIDLTLGGETYEQWSQRFFGALVTQTADADGDGQSNYDEYLAGTDPKSAASRLATTSFAPLPGGGFSLTWPTIAGKSYRVERSTSLDATPWHVVQDHIPGDGQPKTVTDPNPGSALRLFYRIVVVGPMPP